MANAVSALDTAPADMPNRCMARKLLIMDERPCGLLRYCIRVARAFGPRLVPQIRWGAGFVIILHVSHHPIVISAVYASLFSPSSSSSQAPFQKSSTGFLMGSSSSKSVPQQPSHISALYATVRSGLVVRDLPGWPGRPPHGFAGVSLAGSSPPSPVAGSSPSPAAAAPSFLDAS